MVLVLPLIILVILLVIHLVILLVTLLVGQLLLPLLVFLLHVSVLPTIVEQLLPLISGLPQLPLISQIFYYQDLNYRPSCPQPTEVSPVAPQPRKHRTLV